MEEKFNLGNLRALKGKLRRKLTIMQFNSRLKKNGELNIISRLIQAQEHTRLIHSRN